jgi:hypothetical protein
MDWEVPCLFIVPEWRDILCAGGPWWMRRGAGAATRCASASFHRIGLVGAARECCGAVSLEDCTVLSGPRPPGWVALELVRFGP